MEGVQTRYLQGLWLSTMGLSPFVTRAKRLPTKMVRLASFLSLATSSSCIILNDIPLDHSQHGRACAKETHCRHSYSLAIDPLQRFHRVVVSAIPVLEVTEEDARRSDEEAAEEPRRRWEWGDNRLGGCSMVVEEEPTVDNGKTRQCGVTAWRRWRRLK